MERLWSQCLLLSLFPTSPKENDSSCPPTALGPIPGPPLTSIGIPRWDSSCPAVCTSPCCPEQSSKREAFRKERRDLSESWRQPPEIHINEEMVTNGEASASELPDALTASAGFPASAFVHTVLNAVTVSPTQPVWVPSARTIATLLTTSSIYCWADGGRPVKPPADAQYVLQLLLQMEELLCLFSLSFPFCCEY